jgi:hypothetical protein
MNHGGFYYYYYYYYYFQFCDVVEVVGIHNRNLDKSGYKKI